MDYSKIISCFFFFGLLKNYILFFFFLFLVSFKGLDIWVREDPHDPHPQLLSIKKGIFFLKIRRVHEGKTAAHKNQLKTRKKEIRIIEEKKWMRLTKCMGLIIFANISFAASTYIIYIQRIRLTDSSKKLYCGGIVHFIKPYRNPLKKCTGLR